jgi:hypothetical protein
LAATTGSAYPPMSTSRWSRSGNPDALLLITPEQALV